MTFRAWRLDEFSDELTIGSGETRQAQIADPPLPMVSGSTTVKASGRILPNKRGQVVGLPRSTKKSVDKYLI